MKIVAGIDLVRKGKKCLVVSSGQSALHFFSGSFELSSKDENPFKAIADLDAAHPYSKLGSERVEALATRVKPFFAELGLNFKGEASANAKSLLGVLSLGIVGGTTIKIIN